MHRSQYLPVDATWSVRGPQSSANLSARGNGPPRAPGQLYSHDGIEGKRRRHPLLAGWLGLALCLSSGNSWSAAFVVSNNNDAGPQSLRQAILDANSIPDPDTIVFDSGLSGSNIVLTSGFLPIDDSVSIAGLGMGQLTVRTDDPGMDIFRINASNAVVSISSLTVEGGQDGVSVRANNNKVTLTSVRLTDQKMDDGLEITGNNNNVLLTASIVEGGEDNVSVEATENVLRVVGSEIRNAREDGIEVDGDENTVRVENSTIHGNGDGQDPVPDDGLDIDGKRNQVSLIQVTVSGNKGGGLEVEGRQNTLLVSFSTITLNGGDGLINKKKTSTVIVRQSIISANSGRDVTGNVTSNGHNLFGNGMGGGNSVQGDIVGTGAAPIDAQLGVLDANGLAGLVATPSHMPLPGSPAIDAGDPCTTAPDDDQRGPGFPRVVGGLIDIGAIEAPSSREASGPVFCPPLLR
jgi:hypothetical protein